MLSLDFTTTEVEESLVVVNGTINSPPATSSLTGNLAFLFKVLYHAIVDSDLRLQPNISVTTQKIKKQTMKNKICLFFLTW